MEKNIADYVHLYVGCECTRGYMHPGRIQQAIDGDLASDVKLLLRPLSSLTKDEMHECGNLIYDFSNDPELNTWKWSDFDFLASEQFHWLLSKHFDLFGLIESGLAIDKTRQLNKPI